MIVDIYRGDMKVASLDGERLWVADDQEGACRLVMALVQLGVPVDKEGTNRYNFWRVQVVDPDFTEALREYLEEGAAAAFGLTVVAGESEPREA